MIKTILYIMGFIIYCWICHSYFTIKYTILVHPILDFLFKLVMFPVSIIFMMVGLIIALASLVGILIKSILPF